MILLFLRKLRNNLGLNKIFYRWSDASRFVQNLISSSPPLLPSSFVLEAVEKAENLRVGGGGRADAEEDVATRWSERDGWSDTGPTKTELGAGRSGEGRESVPATGEVNDGGTAGDGEEGKSTEL
jgi:hypothetical protein